MYFMVQKIQIWTYWNLVRPTTTTKTVSKYRMANQLYLHLLRLIMP